MPPSLPPLAELAPGLSATGKLDRADIEALAQAGRAHDRQTGPMTKIRANCRPPTRARFAESHGIAYHHNPSHRRDPVAR